MHLCKSPSSGSVLISRILQLKWLLLTVTKRSWLSVLTLTEQTCGAYYAKVGCETLKLHWKATFHRWKPPSPSSEVQPSEFSLSIITVTHNPGFSSGSEYVTRVDKARLRAVCVVSGYQMSSDLCYSAIFILSVFNIVLIGVGGCSLPFFT